MMRKFNLISLALISVLLAGCEIHISTSSSSSYGDSTEYEVIDSYVSNILTADKKVVTPFNTSMGLRTFSEADNNKVFPVYEKEIQRLHSLFDRYNSYKDSDDNLLINLKSINDSYGKGEVLKIDDDLEKLLTLSIELSKLTEGYFNPTMGVLIDEWNTYEVDGKIHNRFSPFASEGVDITLDEVNKGLEAIIPFEDLENYLIINQEENTIEFKKYKDVEKVTLSLGAIAKGYAIEKTKDMLDSFNTSLMIDGGSSSVYTVGKNPSPDRDYWVMGLSSPYKNGMFPISFANVKLEGTYALSTSGDYENCFYIKDENDRKIYRHHILNPFTGYPENYQRVISIVSSSRSDVLDGLSTALFNIEDLDKMYEISTNVGKHFGIEIDFIIEREYDEVSKTLDIYYTEGYKSKIMSFNTSKVKINEEKIVGKSDEKDEN